MSTRRDYYEVLGVGRDSDADAIKKAYRKLAMQFHPDRNPGNSEAEEKFKEAAAAYDVLGNPDKKAQYDRFGHAAFQGGSGFGGGGFQDINDIFANFGDIFGDIFSGGGTRRRGPAQGPRRGSDLRYVVEISLKDVILGLEKDIEFETDDGCETCGGSGAAEGSSPKPCTMCGGRGQVVRSQGFFSVQQTCPSCHGRGQVIDKPCASCRGKGRKQLKRKIRLSIPAGVDTGTRLRVANEGEGGYLGGPSGDLYVEIEVKEDPRFDRDGTDLFTQIQVDYLQLMLGGDITIETLTGDLQVEVPRGTQVGDKIRVPNQGIPSLRGARRGDLYCQVAVEFPDKITKEEEAALRDLAKAKGIEVHPEATGLFGRKKK